MAGLAEQGYLIQCRCDDGDHNQVNLARWSLQYAMNDCHLIQTDWPAPPKRPADPTVVYWITLTPDGAPVACNASALVTNNCTALDLESLSLPEDGVACTNEAVGKVVEIIILIIFLVVSTLVALTMALGFFTTTFDPLLSWCCRSWKPNKYECDVPWLVFVLAGNYMFWISLWFFYEDQLKPKTLRLTWRGSPDHATVASWLNVLGIWSICVGYMWSLWKSGVAIILLYIYWSYATLFTIIWSIRLIGGLDGYNKNQTGGIVFMVVNLVISGIMIILIRRTHNKYNDWQYKKQPLATSAGISMI